MISRSLISVTVLVCSSQAFVQNANIHQRNVVLSSSLSTNNNVPSDEMIRKDIEAMREEAKERLDSLSVQMEDILKKHEMHHHPQDAFLSAKAFEDAELPLASQAAEAVLESPAGRAAHTTTTTEVKASRQKQQLAPPRHFIDSSLLHDTRWKVVVQVGSQRYNSALTDGGEKPLLVHLVVDFTPQLLREGDELLQGSGASVLEVKEAWVGASSTTEGRQRSVKIKSTGGWKVLVGQGPKGIDILRFYIDVEEEICHSEEVSTLRCPAERVYCTGGFFSMAHHNEAEAFKNHLRGQLGQMVMEHDDLALEREQDNRLLSFDGIKRNRKMGDLKQEIKAMNKNITLARIRDPEKAMLRLSRKGDFGVTKEGQVCYKNDTNGPTSEYLVLGKMEMASINKPIIETPSDPNELRP